jgi:hypothetical protein
LENTSILSHTHKNPQNINKLILFNDVNQVLFFGFCGRGKTKKEQIMGDSFLAIL